jgi:hypothetical protein
MVRDAHARHAWYGGLRTLAPLPTLASPAPPSAAPSLEPTNAPSSGPSAQATTEPAAEPTRTLGPGETPPPTPISIAGFLTAGITLLNLSGDRVTVAVDPSDESSGSHGTVAARHLTPYDLLDQKVPAGVYRIAVTRDGSASEPVSCIVDVEDGSAFEVHRQLTELPAIAMGGRRTVPILIAVVMLAAACDDMGIGPGELLRFKVTATNAGNDRVNVTMQLPDARKTIMLDAGVSSAVIGYKSGKFSVTILDIRNLSIYVEQLKQIRQDLQMMLANGVGDPVKVVGSLNLANQQLNSIRSGAKAVGCSGNVDVRHPNGVASAFFQQATPNGVGIWVAACGNG